MIRLQNSVLLAALLGFLAVAGISNANAAAINARMPGFSALLPDPFSITFDEFGTGSYVQNGLPDVHSVAGTLILDPTLPVGSAPTLVLAYSLPEPVVAGTVIIPEPGGGISDVLRFTDATGRLVGVTDAASTIMIFYSDLPEPGEANPPAADTGFPINLGDGTTVTGPTEIGPEGNNFFIYLPGGDYPDNNRFIGISDSQVPEPASLTLLLGGLAAIGLVCRRRMRKVV